MTTTCIQLPPTELKTKNYVIQGNYLAKKFSGYFNGNKTSWHVYNVIWIIGSFDTELDIVTLGDELYRKELARTAVVTTEGFGNDESYTYILNDRLGEMTKRDAIKLLDTKFNEDNKTIKAYSYNVTNEVVKQTFTIFD